MNRYLCNYGKFEIPIYANSVNEVYEKLEDCLYIIKRQVAFAALPKGADFNVVFVEKA